MSDHKELAEELRSVQERMSELLEEARDIIEEVGGGTQARAEAYWIPHIENALHQTGWFSIEETISELTEGD